jgi:hypothetical protein
VRGTLSLLVNVASSRVDRHEADAEHAELQEVDARLADIKYLAEEIEGRKGELLDLKKRVCATVALLYQILHHLGQSFVGNVPKLGQDRSAVSTFFSHEILTQLSTKADRVRNHGNCCVCSPSVSCHFCQGTRLVTVLLVLRSEGPQDSSHPVKEWQWATTRANTTVALLSILQLGASICGGNTQDPSAITSYLSHKCLAQVLRYALRAHASVIV